MIKIAAKHFQNTVPITLVLDNARYQHCDDVKNKAKELRIELLFLPSYSPNLNIIERPWKWIKKDCLHCKYYSKFSEFVEAINGTLKIKKIKKELDTQLSLKFQLYEKSIEIISNCIVRERSFFESKMMQRCTVYEDLIHKVILSDAAFIFYDPVSFHTAYSMFNPYPER